MTVQKRRERYRSEVRAEILAAARDLIREESYEGLTLRKLAQRMEFSPMALYSYFADKQALLTALALQGFEKLAKRLDSKVGRRAPLAALRMVLLDYIAYAEDNPIEYRNVFLSVETLAELKKTKQDFQEGDSAFRVLFRRVEECISAKVLQGDAFDISTVLWTGIHGAATILTTQQNFPFSSRRRYAEVVVATLLAGVQKHVIKRI